MYPLSPHKVNHKFTGDAHAQGDPVEAFEYFFALYEITEVRQWLKELSRVAVTTKNEAFTKAKDRAKVLRFCNEIQALA